jgi:hypothetical protein
MTVLGLDKSLRVVGLWASERVLANYVRGLKLMTVVRLVSLPGVEIKP